MTAARLVLLAVAVLGAVLRPYRLPAFVVPVICVLIEFAAGATSPSDAGHYLRPLADPLGFLLAAIPLAVLLDKLGYFEALASVISGRKRVVGGLWLLGTATVAVLNLDAAVVLLTPLYVKVARRKELPARYLGFQPVILALLASSFLPVSNLTNLIAAARFEVGPLSFIEHLGLPGAVACLVGYWCYLRAAPVAHESVAWRTFGEPRRAGAEEERKESEGGKGTEPEPAQRRSVVLGTAVVAVVLAGFLAGPYFGVREWEVALGADVLLALNLRHVPYRKIPWGTALVAAGLGILAGSAVQNLPLASLFQGSGPLAYLRIAAAAAAGANVVNNLPALLVSLPFVGAHPSCALWPTLLGVNMGPSLLITGSLASLLWSESMRHLGAPVHAGEFLRIGLRVGLPATAAALLVLMAMSPLFGC